MTTLNRLTKRCFSTTKRCLQSEIRLEPADSARMTDIGTRRIFDEDHDAFRTTCRKWFENVIKPQHGKWEEAGVVPREIWQEAGNQGLLGIATDEKYGGIGSDFLHTLIVMEEQSYVNCSGPGFVLHSDIVMPYIENFGTEEQKHHYLPQMTAGTNIGAIAMTEPGAGSDLQGIRTYARRDGDDWILNGSKTYITNGQNADTVIVVAITNPEAKKAAYGVTLFLVHEGDEGFKRGQNLKKLGMKAQDTSELFFDDVRLPMDRVLGAEGGVNMGFMMLMGELPQERLLIGAMAASACENLFEETRDYIRQREAFGKPISNMQLIRQDMAHMKTEIAMARAFTDQCVAQHMTRDLTTEVASMNKYAVSELLGRVTDKCLQLHGGWGYMWEYEICRAYADARVLRIFGGTNEIMKEIISRDIVKPQK